ncbi:MAG: RagB/SusD family nutrient uptake outer membrane protein [Bacteroidales bacterium]|nr:RagB/SusD family nutrient uptake outer membrane protein [Candidatus Cryptobacteroides aphodequi]
MKKFVFAFAGLLFIAGACVNLDTELTATVGQNTMWTTEELVDAGVNGIWSVFSPKRTKSVTDFPAVQCIGRPRLEVVSSTSTSVYIQSFMSRMVPTAADDYFSLEWIYCYEGIHRCNDAIAHIPTAPIDEEKAQRLIAECKIMRAWFYQRLNMLYHGVPVYLEPVENKDCIKGEESAEYVWNVILKDCDDAIACEALPDNNLTGSLYGRPSRGTAYAIRGQVCMWMAFDARKAGDATVEQQCYKNAVDAFAQVDSCGFAFYEGEYADIFTEAHEKNCEIILPVQFSSTPKYGDWSNIWFGSRSTLNSHTRLHPSPWFVDQFQNADGSPFKWTDHFADWDDIHPQQREVYFCRDSMDTNAAAKKTEWVGAKAATINNLGVPDENGIDTWSATERENFWNSHYLDDGNEARLRECFDNRDPRLAQIMFVPYHEYMTCAQTGGKSSIKKVCWPYIYPGNGDLEGDYWPVDVARYWYCYRKFVYVDSPSTERDNVGYDWPLIRYTDVALMKAEALNELGRTDEAIEIVNRVRTRAHMPVLNDGQPWNQVAGKEDMLHRIQYERRIELCGEGLNYFDEQRWGTYKETKYGGQDHYYSISAWYSTEFNLYWKDCLWPWPIPQSEVQKNPNLTRTPGWEY